MIANLNNMTTPLSAARDWASVRKTFVGEIVVLSNTRKGRAGWGDTIRRNIFIINNGVVRERARRFIKRIIQPYVSSAGVKCDDYLELYNWNGYCEVCGTLFTDLVLTKAWGRDPEFGYALPGQSDGWQNMPTEKAFVISCPECVANWQLETEPELHHESYDHARRIRWITRRHPDLTSLDHSTHLADSRIVVDIRTNRAYEESSCRLTA